MIYIETQITTFEQSERLKALGIEQFASNFYYGTYGKVYFTDEVRPSGSREGFYARLAGVTYYAAFTFYELLHVFAELNIQFEQSTPEMSNKWKDFDPYNIKASLPKMIELLYDAITDQLQQGKISAQQLNQILNQ